MDALTEAIAIYPDSEFHRARAQLLQKAVHHGAGHESEALLERALSDYRAVAKLQSFDPGARINTHDVISASKAGPGSFR